MDDTKKPRHEAGPPLYVDRPSRFQPLGDAPFAVFDCETTGTDPTRDRIVSISVVHVVAGRPDEATVALHSLVNPGVPIPPGASAVHGVEDAHVRGKPFFSDIAPELFAALGDRWLAAYNLPFDFELVSCEAHRHAVELEGWSFVGMDPLPVVRWLDRHLYGSQRPGHKLADTAKRFGVELEDAHTSDADALATAKILDPLFRELDRRARGRAPHLRNFGRFWAWLDVVAREHDWRMHKWACSKNDPELEARFKRQAWEELADAYPPRL